MQVESKIRNIKGRTSYLNQRPRRTKSTCASSPFDSAKVVRNTETAKQNLEKLAEKYKGINNVEGFLNDLWLALGLHNQGGNKKGGKPSRYALYQLQDGTKLSISIRASAHNANANKYVEHPPVPDINLSIVLQKKMRKNQFKSNPSVNIGEYVYVNQKIQNVESPLSQIANSLIGFLSNGEYNDTTGVAIVHGNMQTPQEVVNNQTLNCNRNMNKKLIRLTEQDLHRIVKESVNRIINEIGDTEKGQRALGALTAARFKGKKKGDWGEVAKKAFDERDKASNKAAKSGYSENEPWSSLKAWHKKRASMSDAYNDGYQKQVNESGFYPMEYDSKMGYYTPNGTVDGVDTYIDFDEMSFSELKALRDKYLEQVGHTPWNKIANARPDIFHAVNAIEEELEDRRERCREGDKSALS